MEASSPGAECVSAYSSPTIATMPREGTGEMDDVAGIVRAQAIKFSVALPHCTVAPALNHERRAGAPGGNQSWPRRSQGGNRGA
jgi:hypothetical protein